MNTTFEQAWATYQAKGYVTAVPADEWLGLGETAVLPLCELAQQKAIKESKT